MAAKQKQTRPPRYDARVDRLGYLRLMEKQVSKPLADELREEYQPGDLAYGEVFEMTLTPSTDRHISKAAIVKLYDAKQISRAELLDMLTDGCVSVPAAEKVLPGATFKKLCQRTKGDARVCVDEIDEKEVDVKGIAEDFLLTLLPQPNQANAKSA